MATDDDMLDEALEAFDLSAEREADNRIKFVDDVRFSKLSKQWDPAVEEQRRLDNRPCLTINKLKPLIRLVLNDARQNTPAISVHPADDDADSATAEVITGLIRHIEYASKASVAYDTAMDSAVTGGWGYFRINTRYSNDDSFEQDVVIQTIPDPLAVYGDPHSTAADSADWNTAFVVETMAKKAFEAKYKGADAVDWSPAGPYHAAKDPWLCEDTVQVAEWWKREEVPRVILALSSGEVVGEDVYTENKDLFDELGVTVIAKRTVPSHKVTQRIMTGAEVLETINWKGRYIPIIPVYGEVINIEGERHMAGLVRDAKDAQRMFNYWRTSDTELVALAPKAPFIGKKGAFKTDTRWETANSVSHPYLEYDGDTPPQRQPFAGVPAGVLQSALNAADDIKAITGIYDASLGARGNETSGVAIRERQGQGDLANFHFTDNLTRAITHAGTVILDLIPHVYATPRIVRILGEDRDPKKATAIPINQPTQKLGPDGKPMTAPQTTETGETMQGDDGEDLMGTISHVYDLTAGKYDLIVKAGPSFNTIREEAAAQMMDLIKARPELASIIGDLLAKNLDWPGADEIGKRLRAMLPPQILAMMDGGQGQKPQGPDPQTQQMIAQGAQTIQQLQATVQHLQTELQAALTDHAATQTKLQIEAAKAATGQFKAETDRMKAAADVQHERDAALMGGAPQPGMFAG